MSTAGSGPERGAGKGNPAPDATPTPLPPRKRTAIFRWRGIIPLVVILALVGIGWVLFSDLLLEQTSEEAATELLGTEVDLDAFHLHELEPAIDLRGIQVADPFDSLRNLIEAAELTIELEPAALVERKIVIRRLSLRDVRVGTKRETPARHVSENGLAVGTIREVRQWARQFDVPLLQLTPIDTIRSIVLDPTQLTTVRQALALEAQADSVQSVLQQGFQGLDLEQTLDSAEALAKRLEGVRPLQLGIVGTKRAVDDIKRTIEQLNQAKQRVEALERTARSGVAVLDTGLRTLDAARQRDYAFARGLLKLPTFEAPEIGSALFGHVSIDRFQQALYWAELAREYMPPGLLPRPTPGPQRLRRSGTTVHFVSETTYPDFLLQRGDVSFTIGGEGVASGRYAMAVENLTSAPALVGTPTTFSARRTDGGDGEMSFRVRGLIDHTGSTPHESVAINAARFPLPAFDLPGLPFRVDPKRGATDLTFEHVGDRVSGKWTVGSDQVAWLTDTASSAVPKQLLSLISGVITGLDQLDVTAEVGGTLTAPQLSVRSNLDRALAARLRTVAGEEVAKAEARARAAVDSAVREKTQPVIAQVAAVRAEADRRVAEATARLDAAKQKLEEELKSLTGGIIGLPKLPRS
jgi:uncharacterized protein (TIGR03545 family)